MYIFILLYVLGNVCNISLLNIYDAETVRLLVMMSANVVSDAEFYRAQTFTLNK